METARGHAIRKTEKAVGKSALRWREEKMKRKCFEEFIHSENTSICTKRLIRTEKNFLYLFLKDD